MGDTNNTVEVIEAFEIDTLSVDVELKLPEISSNFEPFKQSLEGHLKKFDIIIGEDGVKDANKMATGLNKVSKSIADIKKEKVNLLMAPINSFKENCDQLISLVQNRRVALLTQVKVYEDKQRELVKRFLEEDLASLYEKFGVEKEFQTVVFEDMIIISNKAKMGLTKSAKGQLEARVLECKKLQEKIERRLNVLAGECYKRGLEAPLVRKNIESFLMEPQDSVYEQKLISLIESEIVRFDEMAKAIEEKARKEAEAKTQLPQTPHIEIKHPTQELNKPLTASRSQNNGTRRYTVTATFDIDVEEALEPKLEAMLRKKFEAACFKTMPEIVIVKQPIIEQGGLKEGSLF